jgi:hypothetical protein
VNLFTAFGSGRQQDGASRLGLSPTESQPGTARAVPSTHGLPIDTVARDSVHPIE